MFFFDFMNELIARVKIICLSTADMIIRSVYYVSQSFLLVSRHALNIASRRLVSKWIFVLHNPLQLKPCCIARFLDRLILWHLLDLLQFLLIQRRWLTTLSSLYIGSLLLKLRFKDHHQSVIPLVLKHLLTVLIKCVIKSIGEDFISLAD